MKFLRLYSCGLPVAVNPLSIAYMRVNEGEFDTPTTVVFKNGEELDLDEEFDNVYDRINLVLKGGR